MTILGIILLLWLLPTLIFLAVVAVALPGVIIGGRAATRAAAKVPLAVVERSASL